MAATVISDVVTPEVYDDYFMENSIYKSALWRSGIIVASADMEQKLKGGGSSFNLPFWQSNDIIAATASPVSEGTTLTAGSLSAAQMVARRQFREKMFGQNDVAAVLAGDTPIDGMMELTEKFWDYNYQAVLFNSIQGVIADNVANDSGDMVKDITSDGTTSINSNAVIDTVALYGDAPNVTAIAMHSIPYKTLQKLNLIDSDPDNTQNIGWGTYLGMTVIVDDKLVVSSTYWTILFRQGSWAFAQDLDSGSYVPTEVDRTPASSGGVTNYFTRRVFLMHPAGFAYSDPDTPTYDFPSDAELIAAAQWNRVAASVKNVGFVVLKTLS